MKKFATEALWMSFLYTLAVYWVIRDPKQFWKAQ